MNIGILAVGSSAVLGGMVVTVLVLRRYHQTRRREKAEGTRWMVEFWSAGVLADKTPPLTSESKHPPSRVSLWIRGLSGLTPAQERVLAGYGRWLEARPNAIKLLWRELLGLVFDAVCSYQKTRMSPNDQKLSHGGKEQP